MLLVVEDEPTLRTALRGILEQWNYHVLEAANGKEALAMLATRHGSIGLVLSDVVMPEMGGIALCHAIHQNGWALPVILLSGHPIYHIADELSNNGVVAFFTKPPDLNQLAHTLAETLR